MMCYYYGMTIRRILESGQVDEPYTVSAWLRSKRSSGKITFLALSDGSYPKPLQVVVEDAEGSELLDTVITGCCLRIQGRLLASPAEGQAVELRAERVEIIGTVPQDYPLQKKKHSFEFLRSIPHLRMRTNSHSAVARIRHALTQAVHHFFSERDFIYINTPIITSFDAEGGGAVFSLHESGGEKQSEQGRGGTETTAGTDTREGFFGHPVYLTVSGQLHAECCALALGRVYTFSPTFRAENSNTSRHLSEFWMIEPELCFCDLQELTVLADDIIRSLVQSVLDRNAADIDFFDQWVEKGLRERLELLIKQKTKHISYTDAIQILQKADQNFSYPPEWGCDLQTEHERYLCEHWYQGPIIVYDYPRTLKPFYMRQNDDGKTVAAMDMLVPVFGEIIGGSQREERLDVLENAMREKNINREQYQWYLDLRRYGSAPHAGFGLGFDRLVQYVTGMQNIRDTIPFPRSPQSALF